MPYETGRPSPVPSAGGLVVKNASNRRATSSGGDARPVVHDRQPDAWRIVAAFARGA